ncbi:MAG: serine kinase [Proteobacteria bacterium]|nr:serine kinase [Pseudomonadota bacterium]
MKTNVPELYSDPFGERSAVRVRRDLHLLGAQFLFESNSPKLMRLVDTAYAGLPPHRLTRSTPRLRVRLELTAEERRSPRTQPPPLQMLSGAGLLCGATQASNFVVVSPQDGAALVAVTPRMLRFPYHTRYELIEFAVFTLAARAQGLVSMHGACVGLADRGVLLMGPSGAGKSTVTLHGLLDGMSFLSEDAVFVTPDTLLATGVPNFLHVRADSLKWVGATAGAAIRRSPVIQRRSGVRKYEVDLRTGAHALAQQPLRVRSVVFLSARKASGAQRLLVRLSRAEAMRRLTAEQAYAAGQPTWPQFARNVGKLPSFELLRGQHPGESVAALREIVSSSSMAAGRRAHE